MNALTRREFIASSGSLLAAPMLDALPGRAQERRGANLLSETLDKLAAALLPREKWKPFPTVADRPAWDGLSPDALRALVEAGERNLGASWQPLPATLFLQFKRTGNRSNYERLRSARRDQLRALVMAECCEGRGRFLDDVANGIWTTCEETFWGVPAHLSMQKEGHGLADAAEPVVDLFAAETASLLAWTEYLLGTRLDSVSPLVRKRIIQEVDRRVLSPCLARNDFWWMGLDPGRGRSLNNWTPWINSNWLTCALLLEIDQRRRLASVQKVLRSLDRFLASYPEDGGCDEGPGYWFRAGGSLFDCLELIYSASEGAIDFYRVPLVQQIGRYIYRVHISEDYFVNFADASARVRIDGDLLFRYGRRIGDPQMQSLGAYAAESHGFAPDRSDSIGRQLAALFNLRGIKSAPRSQPFVRDVWLPGVQVMAARRREGSAEGLYLAAQGGHNAESHNHNDVGNFIVYADGRPVIIDVGVETYTAKTFGPQRYEIWTMQSAYHNLPTVGGVMQSAGRQFAAAGAEYRADDGTAEFSLNIAGAYPAKGGLDSWKRTLRLDRDKNQVEVIDSYTLKRAAPQIVQSLMTPYAFSQTAAGELSLGGERFPTGAIKIVYDARSFSFRQEEIRIDDARLRASWGERLYRILLTADSPRVTDTWTLRLIQSMG